MLIFNLLSALYRQITGKENVNTDQNQKRRISEKPKSKNIKVKRIQKNLPKLIYNNNHNTPETSEKPHTGNSAVEIIYKKMILMSDGLREALGQCSAFATYLQDDPEMVNLLKSECQTFEIDYKELVIPTPGQWVSEIGCLKSVLDLKVAIFFAGEKNEEFDSKAPSVEQIQLLENTVPILERLASKAEANYETLMLELGQDLEKIMHNINMGA
jgi:hypothetical protein